MILPPGLKRENHQPVFSQLVFDYFKMSNNSCAIPFA